MKHYVYHLINPILDIPFYVGYTSSPNSRIENHLYGKKNHAVSKYINNMMKYGYEPYMEIIYESNTKRDALDRERSIVEEYMFKYTILNEILLVNKTPKTRDFPDRSTVDARIENCGKNGLFCGIYYGDNICPHCYEYHIERNIERIEDILYSAEELYYSVIDDSEWRTKIYAKIKRIDANYICIPQEDDTYYIVTDKDPLHKYIPFYAISHDEALYELSKEHNILLNINGKRRSSSTGWSLDIRQQ